MQQLVFPVLLVEDRLYQLALLGAAGRGSVGTVGEPPDHQFGELPRLGDMLVPIAGALHDMHPQSVVSGGDGAQHRPDILLIDV